MLAQNATEATRIALPAIHRTQRHGRGALEAPALFTPSQPHRVVFCQPDKEIYGQGERATALYQVETGAVRIYRLLADGRRQISAFHLAGEVFGFAADGQHNFFAEAICSSAIRVHRLPISPDLSREILPIALQALVRAQEHLLVIGRQNAAERVAAFLLDLDERQGSLSHIELAMSRTDIGDYLGLTIETISRVFSKFREKGYIRLQSARSVEVVDYDALHALCT